MKILLTFTFAALVCSSSPGQATASDSQTGLDHNIVVREVSSPRLISFPYLRKGVFKASNIQGAIRLRIFRGAKADVLSDAKAHAIPHGCVRIQSLVVEPTVERSTVLMPFYFEIGWLEPINNRIEDGSFTFVFEVPEDGWHLENRDRGLIQPVDIHTEVLERYFRSGINVTILAPVYRNNDAVTFLGGALAKLKLFLKINSGERALADSASQRIQTSISISQAGSASKGAPPPTKTTMAVSCEGITVAPPPYMLTLNGGDPTPATTVAAVK